MDQETPDLDAIVESTELSTNSEIPMEAPPRTEEAPPPQTPQEYEFEAEGRKYKGDIQKLTRWAQQGVSAPNKIGELSRRIQDYEGKFKSYETLEKTYKPIDEWARQNPGKWDSLVQSWHQAQYGGGSSQAAEAQRANLPPELIQKLQEHDQFIKESQQERTVQQQQAADRGLDGEINSIRKSYPNLDFDAPDASGNSLEFQILEHATRNGIPSFRAAFRDYCFDKLGQMSESKGRETSQMSAKTKAGLLGKDPAPRTSRAAPDLKGRNYDQIHDMVLAELGITG